jgi:hypothetical protein
VIVDGVLVAVLLGTATGVCCAWRAWRNEVGDSGRSGWDRIVESVFGAPPRPDRRSEAPPADSAGDGATSAPAPSAADAAAEKAADETIQLARNERVPPKCREAAQAILGEIETLRGRLAGRGPSDALVAEVESIRTRHLADAMTKYVEIPPEHRAEYFRRTGRSASFQLEETLGILSKRLQQVSVTLANERIDSFSNSNTFINEQFGDRDPFRL